MLKIAVKRCRKNNHPNLLAIIIRQHPNTNTLSLQMTQIIWNPLFLSFQMTINFTKTYQWPILLALIIVKSIFIKITKYRMFYHLETIRKEE